MKSPFYCTYHNVQMSYSNMEMHQCEVKKCRYRIFFPEGRKHIKRQDIVKNGIDNVG